MRRIRTDRGNQNSRSSAHFEIPFPESWCNNYRGMDTRKKLVLFTSLPRVGGHSTLTFGLCRLLRPHFSSVDVWCKVMPEHGHSEALAEKLAGLGCRVRMLSDNKGRPLPGALARFALDGLLHPPDVFFTLAMRNLSPVLATLSRAPARIYYQITHDLKPETIRMLNTYTRFISRIVFICPATYEEFPGAAGHPEKFSWIPQSSEIPVMDRGFLPAERAAALAAGSPPFRLGLIGRLTVEKGAAAVLDFADHAQVSCEIHVAGSGSLEGEFQRRAREPVAAGRPKIHFHGSFDPSRREEFLRRFFNGVDLLMVPSQDEWETLSMAALEALQHGVPSLICRTGGLKSFAHPGLGPAPEDVIRLVDPEQFATTLTGHCRGGRPSWEQCGAACLAHYDRWFSDAAVGGRWRSLLGLPQEVTSRSS